MPVTDAHLDRLAEQEVEAAGAATEVVTALRRRLEEGPVAEVMPGGVGSSDGDRRQPIRLGPA